MIRKIEKCANRRRSRRGRIREIVDYDRAFVLDFVASQPEENLEQVVARVNRDSDGVVRLQIAATVVMN